MIAKKAIFLFGVFLLLFSMILGRSFYIQVISHKKLKTYANSQFLRTEKTYPNRGQIYDRNSFPLAINIQTYNIFSLPSSDDTSNSLNQLKKILPQINVNELKEKLKQRNKFTWVARKIKLSNEDVEFIRKIPGLFVEAQAGRYYPNHDLLAQALGFVDIDNSGLSGVEYVFNEQLKGKEKIIRYMKDAKGRAVKHETINFETRAQDLVLSIDKDIQAMVEEELKSAYQRHGAQRVGAAVMDIHTGELWAIANYPSFDPNAARQYPEEQRKLSFVTDPFEPGSLFKSFTIAAALQNGVIDEESRYYCEKGSLQIGAHTIHEAQRKKHEWLSVSEILKYSSNIGTSKVAFDLGSNNLLSFLSELGIGQKTNIELSAESRGIIPKLSEMNEIKLSNVSFGQGVAITPIQSLAAYAAIANGGYWVQPSILKRSSGEIEKKKILSEENSKKLTKMLMSVVQDGTASKAQVEHFYIAGKTSTAQKVSAEGGYKGYISGFIGYPVMVEKPFVVYVYIDDPQKNGFYGGEIAAPIFKKITQNILYKNKEFSGLILGDISKEQKVIDSIQTSASAARFVESGHMPDFIGLDKRSARQLAERHGIEISTQGFGVCYKQALKIGEKVGKQPVKLFFKAPEYD